MTSQASETSGSSMTNLTPERMEAIFEEELRNHGGLDTPLLMRLAASTAMSRISAIARNEALEEAAKACDAEAARILALQKPNPDPMSMEDTINLNLRMAAVMIPKCASAIRSLRDNPESLPQAEREARERLSPSIPEIDDGMIHRALKAWANGGDIVFPNEHEDEIEAMRAALTAALSQGKE